jgi:hypothetical protein
VVRKVSYGSWPAEEDTDPTSARAQYLIRPAHREYSLQVHVRVGPGSQNPGVSQPTRSGRSAVHWKTITVRRSAAIADALSTSLYVIKAMLPRLRGNNRVGPRSR